MANYCAKQIDEMQAAFGGGFIKARAELGISAFGVQVIRMPANFGDYPEHDHAEDGQEELYAVLEGSGRMDVDGDSVEMDRSTLIRVPSGVKRHVESGPEGITMLVVGGVPGDAYAAPAITELE